MFTIIKYTAGVALISFILTSVFGPVETLPFGIDEAMIFFVSTIKGLVSLFPWLEVVWDLVLLALLIKSLLFLWHWIHTIINLVRS